MDDRKYLEQAELLARSSTEPIKCASVLVNNDGTIVADAFNSQRHDNLVASHAEMKAVAQANTKLGRKLKGITAYGNCEPCTMCLTALIFARVDRIVFSHRLNDLVDDDKRINVDCFDFVKRFPNAPVVEQIQI